MSMAGMLGVRLTGEAWWCRFNTLQADMQTHRVKKQLCLESGFYFMSDLSGGVSGMWLSCQHKPLNNNSRGSLKSNVAAVVSAQIMDFNSTKK